jgi:hypothetical protein
MQYFDPNTGQFGNDPSYGNAGLSNRWGQAGRRFGNRRRRGCLGCLVPLVVIVMILAVLNLGFGLTLHLGPTTIQVGVNPTLIIESVANKHATVSIHAGASNGQIVIQPVRPLNLPFGLAENYQETSDHQTVIYDLGINTGGTYDITVPARTNLKIDTNDTAILVVGITGTMHLETNSNSLTVKNSTIVGPSLLRSNSGAIVATQDQLNGTIVVDDNKGDITFQGLLDPVGTYSLANNGGAITLTLAQNAAVLATATTMNGGTINSNISGVKAQTTANGFTLQANLGTAPRATLTLSNNGGDIIVNE